MDHYKCTICGYVYKPERGDRINDVAPGTPFDELTEAYRCPMCGQPKEVFRKMNPGEVY